MLRGIFFTFFFAVGATALGMMFLLGGEEAVGEAPQPELAELGQRMEGAYSRGASLFQYDNEGYALCEGMTYVASLGPNIKELKLSSQESLNLTVCRRDPETGNYYSVQDINGVAPGDYLFWGDSFVWTPYAQAAMMLAQTQEAPVAAEAEEAPAVEAPVVEAPVAEMTVEEQNTALSQVKFELSGQPAGNPALFIDNDLAALINPGNSVTLPLEGTDRCGVSLQLKGSSGEWEHIHSFGCIDYGASVGLQVEGNTVSVNLSSQLQ